MSTPRFLIRQGILNNGAKSSSVMESSILLPKLDLINNELHDYDIICISESHLDKSITDDQIKLNGFHKPIRLDRNRHGGVEISFKTFKQHSFKRQIRDFKRADYEGLKNQLNDTDWDDVVFNSNNINDVYMNFVKTFESTVNRYIPTKTITVRPNDKPFMNNLIRNKIRHRNRIHHKAKTSNNPDHWKKFREIRNEIISLVRKAKDDYKCKLTSQLIDKNIPPGKWWRIAKSVSNFTKNRDSPPFLEHDGQIFIHPLDKSEILNNHFADIANIDIEPEIPDNNEPPPCHLNKFVITEKEILDQLKILNVNKPAGPDGISPRILKEVASFISKPLTKLFNMSLSVKQLEITNNCHNKL
ncbi:unnamed protein product [Mytilus edulis]|uniref:Uncharacterized protein n=1 Tax=Mytilus edulis TaxID=6550 RepID=A0A8S3T5H6_MYTED|nr:unnamed protein product [Mytilus edulis]